MKGVVLDPLDLIDPRVTAGTLLRLHGALDLRLADARDRAKAAGSLRERLAAVAEAQLYADAIARCREVRAAQNRAKGWHRPARATSPRRSAFTAPTLAQAVSHPPARAAGVSRRGGLAGAAPPPGMGHGWPASASRAGSAAALPGRSDATPADSVKSARHPANPSFCPSNEGISNEINA